MDIILKYFPSLDTVQKEKFAALEGLYNNWNSKINVISRKDINYLFERHVLFSLAIGIYVNFINGSRVLDVGTGGGFPGIPLAILFPQVHFHLIDSIGKKIKVVNEISATLELKNIVADKMRAEENNKKYDFVISRAVTAFPQFVNLVKKNIEKKQKNKIPNGILYLKGGDFSDEIAPFMGKVDVYPLNFYFEEPYFETKKIIYLPV